MRMELDGLSEDGFAVLRTTDSRDLLKLAEKIGVLRRRSSGRSFIDELKPQPADHARTSSMTSRFGIRAFPFHTDGAFLRVPPRFTLLRCESDSVGQRPTFVLDSKKFLAPTLCERLVRHIWQVSVRPSFYCSLLQQREDGFCLRWDPNIIKAAHKAAQATTVEFTNAIESAASTAIIWQPSVTLVLDNWRVLHARADRPHGIEHEDRLLQRVYVDPLKERS